MTTIEDSMEVHRPAPIAGDRLQAIAFWGFVLVLAWAPFPLGSNRAWSWSLLTLLFALCWLLWFASVAARPEAALRLAKPILGPLILSVLALAWGAAQTFAWVPAQWIHPVWPMAAELFGQPVEGTISIDPWRTITAVMRLSTYVAVAWLAYAMASRPEYARRLLIALVFIGMFYALYALILGLVGVRQIELFYAGSPYGSASSGPFVYHNSFATYAGMMTLCGAVYLFSLGSLTVVVGRGLRAFFLSFTQFLFGNGVLPFLAVIVSFTMLMVSGSRAGFLALLAGAITILVLSSAIARHSEAKGWAMLAAAAIIVLGVALFMITGTQLQYRFDALVNAGGVDPIRLVLWDAAERMISDAPLLGLGLGTYEVAYPLYADQYLPYVVDKAHSDYLELASGWGLPAAAAWWLALLWLTVLCLRGVFVRRRNRAYPLLAVGATALVAFHSAFDFSLQIPAISVTYAAILGLGVAQAFSTRPV